MMHKHRFNLISLSLILVVVLTGCIDLFALPNLSLSSDDQWLAVLIMDEQGTTMNLQAFNLADGSTIPIGDSFDRQGAFDWHPTTQEIAYYNLSFDGVPSIKVQDVTSPDSFGIDLFGVFAFPRPFWITQLTYSPDGNYMAMSAILFPDGTDLLTVDMTQITTEAVLYLADLNAGTVSAITDIGERFPSTLTWSPDSSNLAYTAWIDINGDGNPYGEDDSPSSFVYNPATQNTVEIGPNTVSPTWLDTTHVAHIAYQIETTTNTVSTSIQSFNIADNTSQLLIPPSDSQYLYTAITTSPDGSQLAILGTTNQSEILLDESFDIGQNQLQIAPDHIFIANADGANLTDVYAPLPTDILFLDVPVWSSDGSTLYISNANPIGIVTASVPEGTAEEAAQQRIIALNINTPDNPQVIYEGPITSSGVPHLIIGFNAFSNAQ